MEIDRLTTGAILLVAGLAIIAGYMALNSTSIGPISDMLGLGILFCLIGILAMLGHVMGWAPEENR